MKTGVLRRGVVSREQPPWGLSQPTLSLWTSSAVGLLHDLAPLRFQAEESRGLQEICSLSAWWARD